MQQIRDGGAPEPDVTRPPVPPEALRRRVHGSDDLAAFQQVGEAVCAGVLDAVRSRATLSAASRVLDFGCGCGRVITHFRRACDAELYGTDIDGEAIAWCRDNLADFAHFYQNAPSPPLPYEDGFFDFVYSISVFTHLPQQMEMDWLAELRRVTKPGGYLVLTTHGPRLFQRRPDAATLRRLSLPRIVFGRLKAEWRYRRFRHIGFAYATWRTEGLPEFYGNSFHTDRYIRDRWGRLFDVQLIIRRDAAGNQDLVLCRAR